MVGDDLDLERLRVHADKGLLELQMNLYGAWLALDIGGSDEHADVLADILKTNEDFLRDRHEAARRT